MENKKPDLKLIDIEQLFEDMMDSCYDPVKIGSLSYSAGWALKTLDPVAFRIGAFEYAQSLADDGELLEIDGEFFWSE